MEMILLQSLCMKTVDEIFKSISKPSDFKTNPTQKQARKKIHFPWLTLQWHTST